MAEDMNSTSTTGVKWYAGRKQDVAKSNLEWANRQREMALEQDYWQQQFDITNAYNTPEQQLQRLWDANINPLFGLGGDFAGLTQATPSTPHASSYGISGSGGNYIAELMNGIVSAARGSVGAFGDVKSELHREDEFNARMRLMDAQTHHENASGRSLNVHSDIDLEKAATELQNLQKQGNLTDAEIRLKDAYVSQINAQIRRQDKELDLAYQQFLETIRSNKEKEAIAWKNANTDAYEARANAGYQSAMVGISQKELSYREGVFERQLNLDERAAANKAREFELKAREMDINAVKDALAGSEVRVLGIKFGNSAQWFAERYGLIMGASGRLNDLDPNSPEYAELAKAISKAQTDLTGALSNSTQFEYQNGTNMTNPYGSPLR